MTIAEFSNEFDLVYNNLSSNLTAPGLTEYEKSVMLTRAQQEIATQLASQYEANETIAEYLDGLIKFKEYSTTDKLTVYKFVKPNDLLLIVSEAINGDTTISVHPTKLDYLQRALNNPYRKPTKRRCLRTIESDGLYVYPSLPITKYSMIYISKPTPIILEDLSQYNVSIDGQTTPLTSCMNTILHFDIVKRAAELAALTYKSK